MMKYKEIKNLGGGFALEFYNAIENLISAIRNKDIIEAKICFDTLDYWELEKHKQTELINYALNSNIGFSYEKITNILKG